MPDWDFGQWFVFTVTALLTFLPLVTAFVWQRRDRIVNRYIVAMMLLAVFGGIWMWAAAMPILAR